MEGCVCAGAGLQLGFWRSCWRRGPTRRPRVLFALPCKPQQAAHAWCEFSFAVVLKSSYSKGPFTTNETGSPLPGRLLLNRPPPGGSGEHTDYYLYITAMQDDHCDSGAVAWALPCLYDTTTNRPLLVRLASARARLRALTAALLSLCRWSPGCSPYGSERRLGRTCVSPPCNGLAWHPTWRNPEASRTSIDRAPPTFAPTTWLAPTPRRPCLSWCTS
jgi:hypothetical protein